MDRFSMFRQEYEQSHWVMISASVLELDSPDLIASVPELKGVVLVGVVISLVHFEPFVVDKLIQILEFLVKLVLIHESTNGPEQLIK